MNLVEARRWGDRRATAAGDSSLIAAVIVTYNSAAVLPGLLDSLAIGFEGIARHRTIVVDNNSGDNSADLALAHPIGVKVVRMGRNAGYAAAINAAAAELGPDADLLILNPDIRLLPGSVRRLCECLSDPSVGIVAPGYFMRMAASPNPCGANHRF